MLRKIVISSVIILNIFSIVCYADEVELENFPEAEIWAEIESVSAENNTNPPSLNSRAAIVFDRTSKTVIYGKNINS